MTEHNTTGPRSKPDQSPESSLADGGAPVLGALADCGYAPRVSAYHDGEVSQDEAREVESHVAVCRSCAAQLAFFGMVSSTFEGAPVPCLTPDARQRLEGLGDQFESVPQSLRIKPSADVRWVRRLTAVAAVLFIVAVGKVIYEQQIANHDGGKVTPASVPDKHLPPLPQPVSENGGGGPTSPHTPVDRKGPAVTDTDFVVGRAVPKSPTTGQGERP